MEAGSIPAPLPSQTSHVLSDRRALHGAATRACAGEERPLEDRSRLNTKAIRAQILDVQIQIKSWFRVFVLSLGCSVGRQQDSVSMVRTTDCLQQQMRARRSLRSVKLRLIIQTLSGLGGHSCFQKQPPSANILKIKIYIYVIKPCGLLNAGSLKRALNLVQLGSFQSIKGLKGQISPSYHQGG